MPEKILKDVHNDVVEALLRSIVQMYWENRREGMMSGDDAFKDAIKSHRRV
jgi:hypothetical protein